MFNYNKMIKRAIEFFPLWTDIRKRYQKSNGGNFLSSIIDEEITIKETIQEYIDSYFLYNYIGHEDEVMAFSYMANIGLLDTLDNVSAYYHNTYFPFVDTIKEFEDIDTRVYYEEGKIYLKEIDYVDGINTIELFIDGVQSSYTLTKVHVWNIFDEFATFVNTRRQQYETNKELVDRILYITRNLPNGTEAGLKHAIISELMTDFPDIIEDEIIIERPTPENLMKPYEDYETLLDLLAEINRDVYRTKRWDLDYWEYDFESISYIPHIWDKAIKDWQNGVGSYNDLEVIISDQVLSTDVDIYFYKKTLESFQKYVYDKYIEKDINFTLTRYNDILSKRNAKYKITASELEDITFEDIGIHLYESKKQTRKIPTQDLILSWGRNIDIIDNTVIDDKFDYKMKFKSDTGFDLKISQANVIYQDSVTDETIEVLNLLENTSGFIFNSEYELVSDANKLTIDCIEQFTKTEGLMNDDEGFTISHGENSGYGIVSLTDKAGLYVNYICDCEQVSMPKSLINHTGGYWDDDDNYVIRGDFSTEEKLIKFSIDANYFSFNIHESSTNSRILLELIENDGEPVEYNLSDKSFFETERTNEPRRLTITIRVLSINDVKLNNFMYHNFNLELSVKYGELEKTDKGYRLPNFYNNELRIDIDGGSGYSPIIKGIYVGEDFQNIEYLTKTIPYKENCKRYLEIYTNGIIDLIRLDEEGKEDYIIYNFEPIVSYKGLDDLSSLRLDFSDYESIDNIEPDVGVIELIEESGVTYYNLKLKANQITSKIKVTGTKSIEAREVTLEDMVKFYIPEFNNTYDRIYCCKCSKGLIIEERSPESKQRTVLINIKSEIFKGLKISKYKMYMPTKYGSIFGSNNGFENRSNVSHFSFDYISIYPAGSQTYQAINEFDIFIPENKFIPIANNFSPELNTAKSLFYIVELFDEKDKDSTVVRFHGEGNADKSIYDLPNWTIGTDGVYIAIANNIDLHNDTVYDLSTYNVNDIITLSSSVDIKDSYTLSDYTILNTEKYIISTDNENVTIKYDYFDGTEKKSNLLKHEIIFAESDGFNKLVYSNIDTVYHCSVTPFENEYFLDVPFEILKDQGIIVWTDEEIIKNNAKVHLIYSIKKPIAFVFDLEYLYNAIDYDVEAYSQIGEYHLIDVADKTIIDLNNDKKYTDMSTDFKNNEPDLIFVSCSEPTMEARLEHNTIEISKYITEDTILVKTGYYYINGREYYLFSEEDPEELKNNSFYTSHNIDISGGEITTYKPTNNYVSNTEMRLKGMSSLYSFNCKKPLTYGVSNFNYLTACNLFDRWNTFEMKMKLVDGLNNLGIKFIPNISCGYAYIDITDALIEGEENYVSFYATKGLKTYIGTEKRYLNLDVNFKRNLSINIEQEIIFDDSDIRYISFVKEKETRYYLIVQDEGIIDDIIISLDKISTFESHNKNIDLLGFDLYDKKPEGTQYKMELRTDKDYISNLAALMSDGSIKTTSSLDWYITEFKSYKTDNDFKHCSLTNIGVNANNIYTGNRNGVLETQPIYLEDLDNINRIIIKINDIDITEMIGFSTTVMCCDTPEGIYRICCPLQTKNRFNITKEFLDNYIKLKIDIPAYKYINNITIFVDYFSTDDNPLKILTKQSGNIVSKIYDLQDNVNCRVKSIDIEDISNINDIDIYVRASRDDEFLDIWTDWNKIIINDDFKIINRVEFNNTRFLQYKIVVKTRKSFIKFKGINIEIK